MPERNFPTFAQQISSIVQRSPPVPWAPGSIAAAQALADPGAEIAATAGMPGDTIGVVPLERWDIEQGGKSLKLSVFLRHLL
eukprot:scaffold288678_cov21-Tisochrysis_lutea.AAC.1